MKSLSFARRQCNNLNKNEEVYLYGFTYHRLSTDVGARSPAQRQECFPDFLNAEYAKSSLQKAQD